jgi:hypothetical protein
VFSELLHIFPLGSFEAKVTVEPLHITSEPNAVIKGCAGKAFTVTLIGAEVEEHPLASV